VLLAAETSVPDILATLSEGPVPAMVVIDSIQTLWSPVIEAAPGTVSQLRAGHGALLRFAKTKGSAGAVRRPCHQGGPDRRAESDRAYGRHGALFRGRPRPRLPHPARVKNRFGPTDEIGVFEMSDRGLIEVANPSRLFTAGSEDHGPGSAVFAGVEGTRPLLMEIQALVSPSSLGTPRRAVVGFDPGRLAMLLAVLEARGGVRVGAQDVYLNVAGGLKVREPAADLAAAAALISSLTGKALPPDAVFFGEIALSGAVRAVGQTEQRLKEAARLGLGQAVIAAGHAAPDGLAVLKEIADVAELTAWISTLD
jgi:DNA repair protein RadA/Sms